ncbi:MAG: ABC transporter substrate-binding protein [Gammaproteobacteria bacterium]
MRLRTHLIAMLSLLCLSAPAQTQEGAEQAVAVVEGLHTTLVQIMQDADALGYEGRYEIMQAVVEKHFDNALIARVVLSRHWETLDSDQRAAFIATLTRLSIAIYAYRFSGHNGESFQTVQTKPARRGRVLVQTELLRPDHRPVRLDYLLHQRDEHWLIINITANGVSDLSLRRAEYASVIEENGEENGYNTLMEKLEAKIHDMETDTAGDE